MTTAHTVLPGTASGPVLATTEGLSFWGGVDPATARVIDAHHPLHGASVAGEIHSATAGAQGQVGAGLHPGRRGLFAKAVSLPRRQYHLTEDATT